MIINYAAAVETLPMPQMIIFPGVCAIVRYIYMMSGARRPYDVYECIWSFVRSKAVTCDVVRAPIDRPARLTHVPR